MPRIDTMPQEALDQMLKDACHAEEIYFDRPLVCDLACHIKALLCELEEYRGTHLRELHGNQRSQTGRQATQVVRPVQGEVGQEG